MKANDFHKKLQDLIKEIACSSPYKQKKITSLLEETKEPGKEIPKSIDQASRSLVDLRILIKYLLFDLEATKRERDRFEAMLDNDSPPSNNQYGMS